jgi:hypothetical protein
MSYISLWSDQYELLADKSIKFNEAISTLRVSQAYETKKIKEIPRGLESYCYVENVNIAKSIIASIADYLLERIKKSKDYKKSRLHNDFEYKSVDFVIDRELIQLKTQLENDYTKLENKHYHVLDGMLLELDCERKTVFRKLNR